MINTLDPKVLANPVKNTRKKFPPHSYIFYTFGKFFEAFAANIIIEIRSILYINMHLTLAEMRKRDSENQKILSLTIHSGQL